MQKIDAEKLICEIEKRPALWDIRTTEYSDRVLRKQSWEEICILFGKEGMSSTEKNELEGILHRKWKNIRDTYSRDVQGKKRKSGRKGGPCKAPYMYSQQLQFLRDTIESKQTKGLIEEQPDFEGVGSSSNLTPTQTPPPQKMGKKRLHPVEERIIRSLDRLDKKNSKMAENDDNRFFLLSLLPSISSLPKILNSKCRLEMLQVVNKYEEYALLQKKSGNHSIFDCGLPTIGHLSMMHTSHHLSQGIQPYTVAQGSPPLNCAINPLNYDEPEGAPSPVDSFTSHVSSASEDS